MQAKALKFHLETLESALPVGRTLIINASPGAYLDLLSEHDLIVVCQLANTAAQWSKRGIETQQDLASVDGEFDNVIHFATKFATENVATLGHFVQQLKADGVWISVIPNRTGGSRLKRDVSKLFNEVDTSSKAKCRIFQCGADFDEKLARKWSSLNKMKAINGSDLVTQPGVFSAEKLDAGSKLLIQVLENESWYGSVADLGAGYGFLSHCILTQPRQKVKNLCLYELDYRAVQCAKANLSNISEKVEYHWVDVTATVPHKRPFDAVVMNPPFHEAQDASFELGKTFIRQAAAILKPGGVMYLVANLHLPYEKEIQEQFRSHRLLREENGFKVFLARK